VIHSNTNIFHASLNGRSHVNITYLVDQAGNQIQDQNKIKDMFRDSLVGTMGIWTEELA